MLKLFGPVLSYDMIRMARRSRYLFMRCLYILVLLGVLYVVYTSFAWAVTTLGSRMSAAELAKFGETFFGYYLLTQYVVILLITPAYVAGAIAEEKQRKTLEYMLATDLRNREIVLGKLVARLANLLLFLLAGLPVISFAQLFGGIEPELLWCGMGATFVTLLSLTSISILLSVYARRVRDALLNAYLAVIGYFVFWGFLEMLRGLLKLDPPAPAFVLSMMDVILDAYKAGNPFIALYQLVEHVRSTGSLGSKPFELLVYYSIFHGFVILFCITVAILQVRRVYIRQAFGPERRLQAKKSEAAAAPPLSKRVAEKTAVVARTFEPIKPTARQIVRRHPPVSDEPMLWKEIHVERGLRIGPLGQSLITLLSLVVLLPGLIMVGVALLNAAEGKGVDAIGFSQGMNGYVRWIGMGVAAILLLGIGIRASNSIGSERDRMTLDGLLAAPITLANILFAKWLGSILSLRWGFLLLGLIWLFALISAGLHPIALLFLVPCLLAYGAFAASLGLLFSVTSKSGLRAALSVVVVILLLGIAPWVAAAMLHEPRSSGPRGLIESGGDTTYLIESALRATSPFFVLEYAAFHGKDLEVLSRPRSDYYGRDSEFEGDLSPSRFLSFEQAATATAALLFYSLAALGMWHLALDHFKKTCGRTHQRPERPVAPLPVEPAYTAAT